MTKGELKTEVQSEGAVRVLSKEVSGLATLLNVSQESLMDASSEVNLFCNACVFQTDGGFEVLLVKAVAVDPSKLGKSPSFFPFPRSSMEASVLRDSDVVLLSMEVDTSAPWQQLIGSVLVSPEVSETTKSISS